jgi:hypothetical protein
MPQPKRESRRAYGDNENLCDDLGATEEGSSLEELKANDELGQQRDHAYHFKHCRQLS